MIEKIMMLTQSVIFNYIHIILQIEKEFYF